MEPNVDSSTTSKAPPKPMYLITAPSTLRSNTNYQLMLQLFNSTKPLDVEVKIVSNKKDNPIIANTSYQLQSDEAQEIQLSIGQLENAVYKLIVKGKSDELEFETKKELKFNKKYLSTFIQTDKATYKPHDIVKFRAIVVDHNLVPSIKGPVDIFIKDPIENLIKQWKNQSMHMGVVENELQLSEQPPLGDWSIEVKVNNESMVKKFTVAEYVLPTFSVSINLPPYATFNRSDIIATIKAIYTYDRSLFKYHTELEFEFNAMVEESLTGKKHESMTTFKVYKNEIKLSMVDQNKICKPGLQYMNHIKVSYQDDTPVEDDDGSPVIIKYGYSYEESSWNETINVVPIKGLAFFEFIPKKAINGNIGIKAIYKNQKYNIEWITCAHSPSDSFIQVDMKNAISDHLLTRSAKMEEDVTFSVTATEPIDMFTYQIVSREGIVQMRTIRSTTKANEHEFTVTIDKNMYPKLRLIVHYVREMDNEIVVDTMDLIIEGGVQLRTPISLVSNVELTKPGGRVSVRAETNPSAYVGLLGVDQSVLLLKGGNDITKADVTKEIELYSSISASKYNSWLRTNVLDIFQNSGVVIITNAKMYEETFGRPMPMYASASLGIASLEHSISDDIVETKGSVRRKVVPLSVKSKFNSRKIKPQVKTRQKFPETWIWTNMTAGTNGIATYSDTIPDTITSWYISAFAMDQVNGLGIVDSPLKISVFRPFFIKLSLPYSIIRGESVSIPVLIYNYQNKPINAEIVMENEKDEFDFPNAANEISNMEKEDVNHKLMRRSITVPAQDGVSVPFVITPKKLGKIDLNVRASTENAGDAIIRKLLVKPEGQTQYFNKPIFVKLVKDKEQSLIKNISIDISPKAVPGSVRVRVTGVADILGPTINHIDDLLRMPYGCGEQTMINFVPNIVVLDYLTQANRLTNEIKSKAIRHIETGYQRELTYRHDDGSFSAFGKHDKAGSTWLTAYVVKSFLQARSYIDIDQTIIKNGIEYLISCQNQDGSFAELGEIHHKEMQGGAGKSNSSATLTAYVLIAILNEEKINMNERIQESIHKAEDFIYKRLLETNSSYESAIITYALHLADSSRMDEAFNKTINLVKRDANGMSYLSDSVVKSNDETDKSFDSDYLYMPKSQDVESSSYLLLTLVKRANTDEAVSILRWLISKQNSNGGFSSTQDTVIGLQSIGSIASELSDSNLNLTATVTHGQDVAKKVEQLHFNSDNALVLQQIDLDDDSKSVQIEAKGQGTAIIQLSYQYNIAEEAEKPSFELKAQRNENSNEHNLNLDVCARYIKGDATNMALIEVELPSGFQADNDELQNITQTVPTVKRVDTANNEGTVVIYFDQITNSKEICITVVARRVFKVANQKPVPVSVYDYYDRSKMSRIFYEPLPISINDIAKE
ncbi:hypothetical protein RDWZM_004987 [Blomia tropicalis]|uniref:TEP1-F n=1 Tax=Blomia tropicalis TaxID=40697 RepID=A0A9Q0RM69_BLOTA|nr:hypothetical protein RDWZM_004987 [Blomia tropicalis]